MLKTALSNIDSRLFDIAKVVLDADLEALSNYVVPEGIDTSDEFVSALSDMLATVPGLIDWMFFGKDYRFFTGTKLDENGDYVYNDLITIKGAEGYKKGLALILEAIGCTDLPTGDEENALELVLDALFSRVDEILADPANELLEILPNVIYFLNANGLSASVKNMLGALSALSVALNEFGVELDVNTLFGFDVSELGFSGVIDLLEKETGLDLVAFEELFSGLCVGTISTYSSLSGDYAYRMTYTQPDDRKDMITLILTAFINLLKVNGNADVLRDFLGDEAYNLILNLINLKESDMQKIDYIWTEYADTDKVFSALETSELYSGYGYGPLYTREKAQYIADNLQQFIDNIIYLLGIEFDGIRVDNLEDVLNSLVGSSLYNSANAEAILNVLKNAVGEIDKIENSEHIKNLIRASLGVDLYAWNNYTVPSFEDDREMFTKTVCEIIAPVYPVLEWALCDKDFNFFIDKDGEDIITLLGAEGYAYGVVPLMEVLECSGMLTPSEYYSAVSADRNALVTSILNPLFDRIDEITVAPADEILEILPNVIYFINSGGLDTCFKNALHAVYTVLDAIEPLVEVDLYELINVRLDEITFESLFKLVLDLIAEKTGYEFTAIDANALVELTVGKLVSYESVNGNKAYKMVYQSETAKADMVTTVLRLLITFIMTGDNREKAINLLKEYFSMDKAAEKYVRGVFVAYSESVIGTFIGMDKALATTYYLFCGADVAAGEAAGSVKDLNASWQDLLTRLGKSDNSEEATIGNMLAEILGHKIFEDIIDPDEGVAPNGFISFFAKIRDFFQKIIDWFKNIFS